MMSNNDYRKIPASTEGFTSVQHKLHSWNTGGLVRWRSLCVLVTLSVVSMGFKFGTSYLQPYVQVLRTASSVSQQQRDIMVNFNDSRDGALSETPLLRENENLVVSTSRNDHESPSDKDHATRAKVLSPVIFVSYADNEEVLVEAGNSKSLQAASNSNAIDPDQRREIAQSYEMEQNIVTELPEDRTSPPGTMSLVDVALGEMVPSVTTEAAGITIFRSEGTALAASLASSANSTGTKGECDITVGKWVPDSTGPLYRFNQCRILTQAQNCRQNGRPDHDYELYKWLPDQCSIARCDPLAFLALMRGKTLAFIGDSLARNQMESLMCILFQVADATNRSNKQMHRWYFPSYKFTVIRIWSSWLVQSKGDFPPSLSPPEAYKLNLTELDDYAARLPSFDVTVLSSGHWWVRKASFFMNGTMQGGNGFPWLPGYGAMQIGLVKAFGIAWKNILHNVGMYPGYGGLTILRTYTPDHYSGGSWDTGGSCTGETKPYGRGPGNNFNEQMHDQQLHAFHESTKEGDIMPNGSKLKLLDVYSILNHRGDGHPGPYRNRDPLKQTTKDSHGRPPSQDCLHWCMPGPMDSINGILFDILKNELQSSGENEISKR